MARDLINFNLSDLRLSLRYYFLHTPVREINNIALTLRELYPTMLEDTQQHGLRLGDLYAEERLPCFPCIGLTLDGLSDSFKYYNNTQQEYYNFFLDAACRVLDTHGHIDRRATELQRDLLFTDLKNLLTGSQARDITYRVFHEDGTSTPTDGTFAILTQDPAPDLRYAPATPTSTLNISAAFSVEVLLINNY
jgi:hypothetical protein